MRISEWSKQCKLVFFFKHSLFQYVILHRNLGIKMNNFKKILMSIWSIYFGWTKSSCFDTFIPVDHVSSCSQNAAQLGMAVAVMPPRSPPPLIMYANSRTIIKGQSWPQSCFALLAKEHPDSRWAVDCSIIGSIRCHYRFWT